MRGVSLYRSNADLGAGRSERMDIKRAGARGKADILRGEILGVVGNIGALF